MVSMCRESLEFWWLIQQSLLGTLYSGSFVNRISIIYVIQHKAEGAPSLGTHGKQLHFKSSSCS